MKRGATKPGAHGRYGLIPDPKGHRVSAVRLALPDFEPPKSYDGSAFVHAALDQIETSSCTGHATAASIFANFAAKGEPIALPSPDGIYRNGRCIDRDPLADGTLPPLEDGGAEPNQVMRGLYEYGAYACRNGEVSDVHAETINNEPSFTDELDASVLKLTGFYRSARTGDEFEKEMLRAISLGLFPPFAIEVDSAFESYAGGKPLSAAKGATDGAHYIFATGYDRSHDGGLVVQFMNSWGRQYGKNGFGEGDASFIRSWSYAYVMKLARVA